MKRWCVKHNQACDYANSGGDCNVSACQTVIGGDRKMTNREWLETLTDEEFAVWCDEYVGCDTCAHKPEKGFCNNLSDIASFEKDCCIDGTAQWLQAEHKEEVGV